MMPLRLASLTLVAVLGMVLVPSLVLTSCASQADFNYLDYEHSTLNVSSQQIVADGQSTVTVTALLRYGPHDPASNLPVRIVLLGTPGVVKQAVRSTDNDGQVTATVAATRSGRASVAVAVGQADTPQVLPLQAELRALPVAMGLTITVAPPDVGAAEPQTATVRAVNQDGNTQTQYAGTVAFSCTDAGASLPATYTFAAADRGQHTFTSLRWSTADPAHVLTVEDMASGRSASVRVAVTPGTLSGFEVADLPAGAHVGRSARFTVYPIDALGNRGATYTQTVQFASTDAQASLPPPYTFSQADAAGHPFEVTFAVPGSQGLSVHDVTHPNIMGSQGISVSP